MAANHKPDVREFAQRISQAKIAFPRHAIDDVNVMRREAFGQHSADCLGHVFLSLMQPIGHEAISSFHHIEETP